MDYVQSILCFSPWYVHIHNLWLYWLRVMQVCMYARACAQGTDSLECVIHPDSFECVFRMGTVEGVHVCVCMCTVHGSFLNGMISY